MLATASDLDLLARYVNERSHEAFAAIVGRYVDLIYSAAHRQLRDTHLAQDVTQQVFLVLMSKASSIRLGTILPSWLLSVTTFECRNAIKSTARRQRREQKVAQMSPEAQFAPNDDASWEQIAPHLDAALDELNPGDRDAVVLRYLRNASYPDAAALLGASEGSVRQRVHRGLDKMRAYLRARGITTDGAALSAVLVSHGVQVAPPGLAAATLAITSKASAKLLATKGTATLMASTLTKVLAAGVVAGLAVYFVATQMGRKEVVVSASAPQPAAQAPAALPRNLIFADPRGGTLDANNLTGAFRPPHPLFHLILANTNNGSHGTSDGNDHIGQIKPGDWLRFDGVDLGSSKSADPVTFSAMIACADAANAGEIQVRVGSPAGMVVSTLKVLSTGSSNHFVAQLAPEPVDGVLGIHNVFVRFTGGGFNLQGIQFLQTGRSAFSQIGAQSYYAAGKLQNRGEAICEIADGAWAKYDGVDFGQGADHFAITYAVDPANAGGTISVRLDRRDAPPICKLTIDSTGNWGAYDTFIVPHALVRDRHDVYLTFSGKDQIKYRLGDVKWFSFDGPGAKLSLSGKPATQAATQPIDEINLPTFLVAPEDRKKP